MSVQQVAPVIFNDSPVSTCAKVRSSESLPIPRAPPASMPCASGPSPGPPNASSSSIRILATPAPPPPIAPAFIASSPRSGSRRSVSSSAWGSRSLEICAYTGTPILVEDGPYDPATSNDRLLLGLKGTISETELYILGPAATRHP